ncbi:hypothetical protein [Mycobacterium sp.]|jgi:hypothetical protein|uniref:hypothetical protein n=1 Tax=Mycobacterium sp. TaxID=1785 RepID=UPI002D444964|nr:hypothetical protein [Mycobacterium sp.]HZA10186.1 hypothetical protein [Mycobacterium sp.]
MKKNVTFATIAASALGALTIGLAAPAIATPSGSANGPDIVNVDGYMHVGHTPYGTYQNAHKGR